MNLAQTLFPSDLYNKTNIILDVLMPVASITPPTGRIASCVLTIIFVNIGQSASVYTLPIAALTSIPVNIIHQKYQNLASKISWLSPAINIGAITAVAYSLFNFVAHPYAKVAVFAIHQAATGVLGRAQSGWGGIITLDNGFSKLLGVNEQLIKGTNVDPKRIDRIA